MIAIVVQEETQMIDWSRFYKVFSFACRIFLRWDEAYSGMKFSDSYIDYANGFGLLG